MRSFPFKPRSTAELMPGDFWALPLTEGKYGCGRVVALKPKHGTGSRFMFLAALLDWIGTSPPTSEHIASCSAIAQGQVHLRSVYETGGQVLGNRPLETDGIEPAFFLSESPGVQCMLLRGYEPLRSATAEEQASLPVFRTWGYLIITHRAEELAKRAA
jgi:hypothetical protein